MILYKCLNHGGRLVSRLFHVWQVENGRCVCVCGGGEEMDGRGLSALMNTKSDL